MSNFWAIFIPDDTTGKIGAGTTLAGGFTTIFQALEQWSTALGTAAIIIGLGLQLYSVISQRKEAGRKERREAAKWRMEMKQHGATDSELDRL